MIPDPGSALRDLAGRMAMNIAPEVATAYGAADAGIITMLLIMLADETEAGIDRAMQDADDLRSLFQTAGEAPRAAERQAFADSAPASLRHTDVSAWLDRGLELLIELHAWAEANDPDLDGRIWDLLHRHTERHRFDL